MKNYIGDILNKKEKAEEDIYFAKLDQMLIKEMHRKQALKEKKSSSQSDKTVKENVLTKVSDAA